MDNAQIDFSPLLHAAKGAADTPALMVDLDALDANIATIADACRRGGDFDLTRRRSQPRQPAGHDQP